MHGLNCNLWACSVCGFALNPNPLYCWLKYRIQALYE